MTEALAGIHLGVMDILVHQKSVLGNISDELNYSRIEKLGFPGGAVVENLPANAGDTGSSPGLGGSHMPRSN